MENNQIEDIGPLSEIKLLTNLETLILVLNTNLIVDIDPIAEFNTLPYLSNLNI